jgi:hypothetical protein
MNMQNAVRNVGSNRMGVDTAVREPAQAISGGLDTAVWRGYDECGAPPGPAPEANVTRGGLGRLLYVDIGGLILRGKGAQSCGHADELQRVALAPYAAMVVPVISCQVWNRCAICWRYSGAEKR